MATKKKEKVKKEINPQDYPDYGDYLAAKRVVEVVKEESKEEEE